MNREIGIALGTTLFTFVGGLWLFFAPFAIGYQPIGHHWVEATRNDLWIGAGLIFFSAATLLLFLALSLRDASREALARRTAEARAEREERAGR